MATAGRVRLAITRSHRGQPRLQDGDQGSSFLLHAGGDTDGDDRAEHLVQRPGVHRQHLAAAAEVLHRGVDVAHVDGAHRAQVLGEDEVGIDLTERTLVESVEVFPGGQTGRTCSSISFGGSPSGSVGRDTTRRAPVCGGKSHSIVTPAPMANRISVVDGSSDTIRMPAPSHGGR